MKVAKSIAIGAMVAFVLIAITSCKENNRNSQRAETESATISKEEQEDEVWKMEEQYWDCVEKIDTVAYKKLWHNEFIGYPSFGDGVSNKGKIAIWIPELHKDTSLAFSYKLYKKAVNAIDDVVTVFYDADEIWTDKENRIVKKETYKFTHTWKKYNDNWVILEVWLQKRIRISCKNKILPSRSCLLFQHHQNW